MSYQAYEFSAVCRSDKAFYLITDLRVNKSLPLLAYKNETGYLLRNCFKDLPGFRYYPGE
ncbi:hypothetical protein C7K59_11855 [Escherichia coli]|nr:hypothetical protein C7K59_11855 [Escherichia coli]